MATLARSPNRPPTGPLRRTCWSHLDAVGRSDVGCVRAKNEDAYAVELELAPGVGLLAVADGVGGYPAGDVAARIAIELVVETVREAARRVPPKLGPRTVVEALECANAAVRALAERDPNKQGMASTFTGALVLPDRVIIGHAGDSRAYHLRGRRLVQLTEDDTLANACVRAGTMTREQAETSPFRSTIVRGVGVNESIEIETRVLGIAPGNVLLLTTDGLHGLVSDREIQEVLVREHDLARAADELVTRANDAGGPDNITVVLARVT